MRAVVDGIARDHEADRGHVEAGGVVRIGVAELEGWRHPPFISL